MLRFSQIIDQHPPLTAFFNIKSPTCEHAGQLDQLYDYIYEGVLASISPMQLAIACNHPVHFEVLCENFRLKKITNAEQHLSRMQIVSRILGFTKDKPEYLNYYNLFTKMWDQEFKNPNRLIFDENKSNLGATGSQMSIHSQTMLTNK